MAFIHRYRVRAGSKTWADPGPDLLRPLANAVLQTRALLRAHDSEKGFAYRVDKGEWREHQPRHRVMEAVRKGDFDTLTVSVGDVVVAQVKHEKVLKLPVASCSVGVSAVWSLIKHQFHDAAFAGGYVYKMTFPGFWSDHAWGDAVDATPENNDKLFNWLVRMAREGCVVFDYVIGSVNGHVSDASAPAFETGPSNADSSHEWHCHISVLDHDGAKPPREGGR